MKIEVLTGATGLGVAVAVILLILRWWRPGKRSGGRRFSSVRESETPRFGGVALAAALVVCGGISLGLLGRSPGVEDTLIVLSALAMFGIGVLDDCRAVRAKVKLGGQVLVALTACWAGLQIEVFKNPITGVDYVLGPWTYLATVLWLVALTNLINLIDGIDGLAGGISLMLLGLLLYVGFDSGSMIWLMAVGMAGALAGFLLFNLPPARIYMGDGGAYLLGFLIGALAISNSQKGTVAAALVAPVIALALPILDLALAVVRRWLIGFPIFRPDRKHIHHRLVKLGFSHRRTLVVLYAASLVFLTMAFGVFWSQGRSVPISFGVMFLIVLVALQRFGYVENWFAVGKVVGQSLSIRKETRYALSLSHWLELEADRAREWAGLWENYLFLLGKLGFEEIRVRLGTGAEWRWRWREGQAKDRREVQHEINVSGIEAIEFIGGAGFTSNLFEYLGDLAAEAWIKAAQRFEILHPGAAGFDPRDVEQRRGRGGDPSPELIDPSRERAAGISTGA